MKKKQIIPISLCAVLLTASIAMLVGAGINIYKYCTAYSLCEQIAAGEEIDTDFSNGATGPEFFNTIASFIDADGPRIPLVEACRHRNVQAVKVLLENGADPNYAFDGNFNALEASLVHNEVSGVDERCFEIVKLLVEHGADINAASGLGETVTVHVAGMVNNSPLMDEIFSYLLENGGETEFQSEGYSWNYAFWHVIRKKSTSVAGVMLDKYGADVNESGYEGATPLIMTVKYAAFRFATEKEYVDMVSFLLEKGADPSIRDEHGKTAYDYAVENGFTEIADILNESKESENTNTKSIIFCRNIHMRRRINV